SRPWGIRNNGIRDEEERQLRPSVLLIPLFPKRSDSPQAPQRVSPLRRRSITMLVIKIGGGAAIGEGGFRNFARDLASFTEPVVIIHGGNAGFSELSRQLGMPPRMVTSSSGRVSRYTDGPTMDAMLMAYCGKVNKRLVATLRDAGVNAVGLSAIDGG